MKLYTTNNEILFINSIGTNSTSTLNRIELLGRYLKAIQKRDIWRGIGLDINRDAVVDAAKERIRELGG